MNIVFNKKRFIIFSIISFLLCIAVVSLHSLFVENNNFQVIYFALTLLLSILIAPIQAIKLNITKKYTKLYSFVISCFSIMFICFIIELLNNNNMFTIRFDRLLFNFIIIAIIYLFTFCITNKIRLAIVISNISLFLLGFANYMVLMFRGTPLSFLDVLSIRTGISVAFTYKLNFTFYLILSIVSLIFLLSIVLNIKCKYNEKNKLFRIISFLCSMITIFAFFTTNFVSVFKLNTNLWIPSEEYKSNGFLASFIKQSKEINMSKPEGYSLELLSKIRDEHYVEEMKETNTPINEAVNENKPNIIVIMNESFSDMAVHRQFKTNIDYMPYIKSLMATTLSGNVHSSVYGGKTPNAEWEFLTNNSMAFFSYANVPYQQFISKSTYSLVSTLKSQGYTTHAIHPWYSTGYRRNTVYQLFDFDTFDALENMKDELEYIRTYPSDLSTYKYLVKQFESRDKEKPFFNFTITMQNHSGYDIPGMDSEIFLIDIPNCPRVEQYLTLIKKSDDALKYLLNYFSNTDEHTIILFFGDHQPPYIEEDFWEYLNAEKNPNSLEDTEKGYLTPYFIWANYNIPKISIPEISLNYLSVLLLDVAELKTTTYMNYLRNMQKEIPVITGHGYMTKDGTYHDFSDNIEVKKWIEDYKNLQFNNMFDKKNSFDELFKI